MGDIVFVQQHNEVLVGTSKRLFCKSICSPILSALSNDYTPELSINCINFLFRDTVTLLFKQSADFMGFHCVVIPRIEQKWRRRAAAVEASRYASEAKHHADPEAVRKPRRPPEGILAASAAGPDAGGEGFTARAAYPDHAESGTMKSPA